MVQCGDSDKHQKRPEECVGSKSFYASSMKSPLEGSETLENASVDVVPKDRSSSEMMLQIFEVFMLATVPLVVIVSLLGWVVVPYFIRYQISNKVVISPEMNPELYGAWLSPPVPVYLKVYLFNVTNAENVRKDGARPILQEIGPYVFLENRTKVNVLHDEAMDTATYNQFASFHFDKELSGTAKMSDQLTLINLPFAVAAINAARYLPWPLDDLASTILINYKEPLFVIKRVEEVLFKGWNVPFLQRIHEELEIQLLPNNQFGLLLGQNNSVHGPYTVARGRHNSSMFGHVLKYKNETTLDFWGDRSTSCNQIIGTDGTMFPPFVTKESILRIFNEELCRSAYIAYAKDTNFKGISGYRFIPPLSIIEDPHESEENSCFCQKELDEFIHEDTCLKQGAFNLGPCRDGVPVAMSPPHFLDANPEYTNISGLSPSREKHETFLEIEPLTGIVLRASKKIQINLILKPVRALNSAGKVPNMLLPLMWADEYAELDDEHAGKLKNILFQLWLLDIFAKWGLLGGVLLLSLLLIRRKLGIKHVDQMLMDSPESEQSRLSLEPENAASNPTFLFMHS